MKLIGRYCLEDAVAHPERDTPIIRTLLVQKRGVFCDVVDKFRDKLNQGVRKTTTLSDINLLHLLIQTYLNKYNFSQ